jgi:hypothetical protein
MQTATGKKNKMRIGALLLLGAMVLISINHVTPTPQVKGQDQPPAPVEHAITGIDFRCRHVESLTRIDQALAKHNNIIPQLQRAGECFPTLPGGTAVRIEQRSGKNVCVTPAASSEPCMWTGADVVSNSR